MNLLLVKDIVEQLLVKKESVRDDNKKLVANIWLRELKELAIKNGKSIESVSARSFLEILANNELSDYESITRVSRSLQEKYPIYRGKKYKHRLENQELVKEQLNQI